MRRLAVAGLLVLAVVVAWRFWPRAGDAETVPAPAPSSPTAPRKDPASDASAAPAVPRAAAPVPRAAFSPEDFPIVAPLNAPGSNIRGDLETLSKVFDAWRSNFPRDGNPVGENAEITAALAGANRLEFALIPKDHPAINAAGELCDRWGTPFRFHQLSGQHMEIQSAGPDRKFGTPDDEVLTP